MSTGRGTLAVIVGADAPSLPGSRTIPQALGVVSLTAERDYRVKTRDCGLDYKLVTHTDSFLTQADLIFQ